jgi:hypothetical protein
MHSISGLSWRIKRRNSSMMCTAGPVVLPLIELENVGYRFIDPDLENTLIRIITIEVKV